MVTACVFPQHRQTVHLLEQHLVLFSSNFGTSVLLSQGGAGYLPCTRLQAEGTVGDSKRRRGIPGSTQWQFFVAQSVSLVLSDAQTQGTRSGLVGATGTRGGNSWRRTGTLCTGCAVGGQVMWPQSRRPRRDSTTNCWGSRAD